MVFQGTKTLSLREFYKARINDNLKTLLHMGSVTVIGLESGMSSIQIPTISAAFTFAVIPLGKAGIKFFSVID